MEILIGMILLLQVLALIQLMLTHRQMLQQINKQQEKLDAIWNMVNTKLPEQEKNVEETGCHNESDITIEPVADGYAEEEKKAQEALINEVLSEVFS